MEQTDKDRIIANAEIHLNDAGIFADMFISSSHYYAIVQLFAEHETQVIPLREQLEGKDEIIKAWSNNFDACDRQREELRERLEKVEKENEKDKKSLAYYAERLQNIIKENDNLIIEKQTQKEENERLRELLSAKSQPVTKGG